MSNYSLRKSVKSCAIDGKCGGLNRIVDRLLRNIFGDFHWEGPRNWVGGTREGEWSQTRDDLNPLFVFYGFVFALIPLFAISVLTSFSIEAIIYTTILSGVALIYFTNWIDKRIPLEFMSHGKKKEFWIYCKKASVVAIIWLLAYLLLGGLWLQTILPPQQVEGLSRGWGNYFTIAIVPYVEESFFLGLVFASLATYTGIIPSLLLTGVTRVIFHSDVFGYSGLHLLMTFLFAMIVYPVSIQYKNKDIAWFAHIIVNTVATALIYIQ